MSAVQATTVVQCSGTKLPEQLNTLYRLAEQNTEQSLNKESLLSLISRVSPSIGLNKPLNNNRTNPFREAERSAEQTVIRPTATPPATQTAALCVWLRSLRLPVKPVTLTTRWAPSRTQEPAPDPGPPPYIASLADCLERIGAGVGTAADAVRALAWLPNGVHIAQIVRDKDLACGEALLLELKRLEDACRPCGPLPSPQQSAVTRPNAQGFPSLIITAEA